jgi:trehalose 6-phosphate phosphatase
VTQQPPNPADSALPRLPSALDSGTVLAQKLERKRPAVFLDYDGTLTHIVARPELAILDEAVRRTLAALAKRCPVAIVSGRDRADVEGLVGLDNLIYAGSHGFDIRGRGLQSEHGAAFLPDLDDAEAELRQSLAHIRGALLERKTYSLAVHVRGLAPDAALAAEAAVDGALSRHSRLRKGTGKMVFELLPRLDWHKGKAVLLILQALRIPAADVLPIYIGDDRTDEDAFGALHGRGVGILVAESPRPTAAYYTLRDPDEVHRFLQRLVGVVGPRDLPS